MRQRYDFHTGKKRISALGGVARILLCLMALAGCNATRFMPEGEKLIKQNEIVFQTEEKIKNKNSLRYELSTIIPTDQRPNSKLFRLFPARLWFYYKHSTPEDTSKFDRWIQNVVAEPPAYYDPDRSEEIAQTMAGYLRQKGYWQAEVQSDSLPGNKKVKVRYNVDPGKQFQFGTVEYVTQDSNILALLEQNRSQAFLEKDGIVDAASYNQEVQRITQLLRNNGYALFYPNYIPQLTADTSGHIANARLTILPYQDSLDHSRFQVGQVAVLPRYRAGASTRSYNIKLRNVDFYSADGEFDVKPTLLRQFIFLEPGDLFQQRLVDKTKRQLSNLEYYYTPSIIQQQDSLFPDRINFEIRMLPKKLWAVGYDLEFNTISGSNSLIGASINFNLLNRNPFRGAEQLNTSLSFGTEFSRNLDQQIISLLDARFQTDLEIPKFIDPFNFYRFLRWTRLLGEPAYEHIQENTISKFSLSYNFVSLIDFIEYNLLNAGFSYEIRMPKNNSLIINHLGIDFLNPRTGTEFNDLARDNPFLRNSFGSTQLFTGLLLRDAKYFWRKEVPQTGDNYFFKAGLEISGAEAFVANTISNSLNGQAPKDTFKLFGIPFSHFLTLEWDGQYMKKYKRQQALAFRFNTAVSIPYSFTREVPYVKQFFVGGPSSIRAFPIRQVGPGGYDDPARDTVRTFYQTGDLKLEFSMEYRFKLFWRFEGALFLDGGNVWTLKQDPDRPGSQFRFSKLRDPESRELINDHFLNQLALGSGFGLRIDFLYFIARVDMGYPLRTPYEVNGSHWTVNSLSDIRFRDFNFNIAIGYPFM